MHATKFSRFEARAMTEREIFLAALEIDDLTARRAHLQTACGGDLELQARIESMLTLNESQSLFLETPVVEQMAGGPVAGFAPTLLYQNGSTEDQEGPTGFQAGGGASMSENRVDESDEIPLGYLQPSDKPGSIGRLAHYDVLEVLGRGAFGIVLKAMDEKLQRMVAIKVLAPEIAATSPARKRFLREARASAAIRHEHVVNIHAVDESPLPYLVMEYIPGQTLQQRLDGKGPLEVLAVVQLGRQIAEGLAAAHEKDLIHRDIKPGNILLEAGVHERVKITDFGLARAADDASMTRSGLIAGTPMYMAPEQALGKKLDQRADLFSLGSVLYQMVSGRPPFRAANTLAVLKRVTEVEPRPIQEIIPETPMWLSDIIGKLHAKDPDKRYQSAREVADVFADCEEQLKAHARVKNFSKIPSTKPTQGAGRRKWVAAAALLLPLLALTATETAGVTQWFRSSTRESEQVASGGPAAPNPVTNQQPSPIASKISPDSSADILTSDEYEWTVPVNLGPSVNSAENDSDLWVSADGLKLLFNSDRPGGTGSYDLWECRRSRVEDAWSAAVNLGEPVNSVWFDVDPQLSADGKSLVFVSARNDNTVGEMDLWLATRESANAAWNKAVNLGPRINSSNSERCPVLSADGLQLIFASNRRGSWEPWTTSRSSVDEEWSVPVPHPGSTSQINQLLPAQNIYLFEGTVRDDTCGLAHWNSVNKTWEGEHRFPPPINDGSGNGSPYYVPSSRSLYFESNRSGGQGGVDLWMSRRVKKGKVTLPDSEARRIAALPAAGQVEEVRKELMRRNPGFDGRVEHKIEDGVVTEIRVVTDKMTDIAPIRVFNALRSLDLSGTELDGQGNGQLADLAPLKDMNLSSLTYLSVACTKIDDVGLAYFRNCNNLMGLRLNLTRVTNAGMANFEGCQKLQSLDLKYTKVDDVGLAHFKGCKDLNGVDFGGLNMTDEGLAYFKDCKGLAYLWLNDTRVTDVGLAYFKDYTTLTHLHLASTQATNAALANFRDCKDLTLIILENTKITDAGLVHLKNCKKLSVLNLMNTSVTAGAIDELKKTYPKCRIEWDGGVIDPKVGFAPFPAADVQRIAALPAAKTPPLAVAPFDTAEAKAHQTAWAEHLGVPVEYTNSIGMKFRLIPPGEFTMGSTEAEIAAAIKDTPEWANNWIRSEGPARKVRISEPFYLGTTEVTVGQFRQFVAATGYKTYAETSGNGQAWTGNSFEARPEFTWQHPDMTLSESHPVGQLCPADANAFCSWLEKTEGARYQLPEEEQWEYACRAGTTTPWSFKSDDETKKEHGVDGLDLNFTGRAVAQMPPNPFGLFDVHGNLREFCRAKDGTYIERGGNTGIGSALVRSAARGDTIDRLDSYTLRSFRASIVGNLPKQQ
jgi:serine/threonine protein kinase/formylglycine-generating enzyme required for sulfatase activity